MVKPKLLDLFCKAGGAGMGYHRAGFDVVGVDIEPQPNYPFTFVQGDAIEYLLRHGHRYDVIHASPPCHDHTTLKSRAGLDGTSHLLDGTRQALRFIGGPWVIENVIGAPMRSDVVLCGEMFNLGVIRHRAFESDTPINQPTHRKHRGRVAGWRHGVKYDGPYAAVYGNGGGKGTLAEWSTAMGIDWMTRAELAQAIPPAYTEFLGKQFLERP